MPTAADNLERIVAIRSSRKGLSPLLVLCLPAVLYVEGCCPGSVVAVGSGAVVNWSMPAPLSDPGTYMGLDASFTVNGLTGGLCVYTDWDSPALVAPYMCMDYGPFMLLALGADSIPVWPIVKPLVGYWNWRECPGRDGLLYGFKTGLFVDMTGGGSRIPGPEQGWATSFEYGWLWLRNASGNDKVRAETVRVALLYFF